MKIGNFFSIEDNMDASDVTTYTLEGALSLLLAALAFKIYRMRVRSESSCCGDRLHVTTSNRGDSSTDLQMVRIDNPDLKGTQDK